MLELGPGKETAEMARRLHVRFGHPTNEVLLRMLRLGGAGEPLQQAVRDLECTACARNQRPQVSQKVRPRKADEFREVLCLDIGWVEDIRDRSGTFCQ